MNRLRVALVGTGFIAGRHLGALAAMPEVEVAVADPVLERAEAAAQQLGARAHADGLALLAAEDLDAVWLCVRRWAGTAASTTRGVKLPPDLHGAAIDLWEQCGLTRPWNDPKADLRRALDGSGSAVLAAVAADPTAASATSTRPASEPSTRAICAVSSSACPATSAAASRTPSARARNASNPLTACCIASTSPGAARAASSRSSTNTSCCRCAPPGAWWRRR